MSHDETALQNLNKTFNRDPQLSQTSSHYNQLNDEETNLDKKRWTQDLSTQPAASNGEMEELYDDVLKWKHFPRYWPFVRGIHRSPMTSPHKGQWRGALSFSLNGWTNNREAGDLKRHPTHYDATIMILFEILRPKFKSHGKNLKYL